MSKVRAENSNVLVVADGRVVSRFKREDWLHGIMGNAEISASRVSVPVRKRMPGCDYSCFFTLSKGYAVLSYMVMQFME